MRLALHREQKDEHHRIYDGKDENQDPICQKEIIEADVHPLPLIEPEHQLWKECRKKRQKRHEKIGHAIGTNKMQNALGAVGNACGRVKGKRHDGTNGDHKCNQRIKDGQNPKQSTDNGQELLEPNNGFASLNGSRLHLAIEIPRILLQLKKIIVIFLKNYV